MRPDLEGIVKIVKPIPLTESISRHICGTWMPGLYFGNGWFRDIDKDAYFSKYLPVVQAILARPLVRVNVALLEADQDCCVAYAVTEYKAPNWILHWCYTRPDWRRNDERKQKGLARELLPEGKIVAVTHLTKVGRAIKPKEWIFDPFL